MKSTNMILMADVIGSRLKDQKKLINNFQKMVSYTNELESASILSPITITLGDEFQGVIKDLSSSLAIILLLEERIISTESDFKLRYVLFEGNIETEINKKIAYGMLGSGLTSAREHLVALKGNKNRFYFNLVNQSKANALNNIFFVLQSFIDDWDIKRDYYIVSEFLQYQDYKKVALNLEKDRSLIWKREKTLKLDEYFAVKKVIKYLAEEVYE